MHKQDSITSNNIINQYNKKTSSANTVRRRRPNFRTVQNVLIVWLDKNIDDKNDDFRHTITHLKCAVNTIQTFTDVDQCIEFIENIINEKACLLISGSLGQEIVPRIHHMSQVDSIFIFCNNRTYHEQWIKEWTKIKGVFTEIRPICDALKQTARQCEQNAISMSFVNTDDNDAFKKNLDQLDSSFMYTQILKEILLEIKFNDEHIKEFVRYCRDILADNETELKNIEKFEQDYHNETPIWWYSYECFLYPMLNRALRLMDVDLIIKLGFFTNDLHRHLKQLHQEQFASSRESFIVYRGQGMTKEDFETLTKTTRGLLSFNCFLSTSKNRKVSVDFAHRAAKNNDLIGVLFVMTIDPSISSTPFASVTSVSYYKDKEDEILVSMHTVFRIGNITHVEDDPDLFQVELTLTSDDDKDLHVLTDHIRKESECLNGWNRLGELLLKMGQAEKAQQVYEILLEETSEENEKARIYHQLGKTKYYLGEFMEALTFYEKALEIQQQSFLLNHLDLAKFYNNIGVVCYNMGEYSKALSYYQKALELKQQSLPPNDPDLASSYNNIGLIYDNMGNYSKGLASYEKALEIKQQALPFNHPDLASSYVNIGNVYDKMGEYSKALSSHKKALEIQQQSLPPNHPDLASSYNNIGLEYKNLSEYSEALSNFEKALEIQQQSLPANHPSLATSYNNMSLIYRNTGEYDKALSSQEKALEIQQQALPSNHPDLACSYNNIGLIYNKKGEYSNALSSYEKALEIRQQTLPSNHPDLASSYGNIGNIYNDIGDYAKALSAHKKALEIQQQSLSSTHLNLSMSFYNIGLVYEHMGEYSEANLFYERAVEIGQQSLPTNHPYLQTYIEHLDRVKKRL